LRDTLSAPELSGRIELLPTTAGLWTNAIVTLKEGETTQDIIAKARQKGVVVGAATEFAPVLQQGQSSIKITFALPEDVVREGAARLKASLL
jgi:DNA-binding transcriptional MocR family regulator